MLLYDNLKSALLERVDQAIRFHPKLLELAAHYRFEPRPVAVARGNEKGRAERAIRFAREAFFTARRFRDLADLNAQALTWCQGAAAERPCPEDRSRAVREVFEEERPYLLALPENPFPCEEKIEVSVHKTPYMRFDLNDYSILHTRVKRTLAVAASLDTVRILDGDEVIATHARSFDRGAQLEDPSHIEALVSHKRTARVHRAQDRLHHAAPSAKALFLRAAERGALSDSVTDRVTPAGMLRNRGRLRPESVAGIVGIRSRGCDADENTAHKKIPAPRGTGILEIDAWR